MKRITLLAHRQGRKAVMELLQRRGAVQVSDIEEQGLEKLNTASDRESFERGRRAAEQALAVLSSRAPQKKKGLLARFAGQTQITPAEYQALAGRSEEILAACHEILRLEEEIRQSRAEIARLAAAMDALAPWLGLDVLPQRTGLHEARVLVGTLPHAMEYGELVLRMGELLCEQGVEEPAAEYELLSSEGRATHLIALCHASIAEKVENALRSLGFQYAFDQGEELPTAKRNGLQQEVLRQEKIIEQNAAAIAGRAELRPDIEFLIDHLTVREERYRALERLALTNDTFVLEGYIPVTALAVVPELEQLGAAVDLADPGPDEDVPVLLKNNGFVEGVEPITEMFSMPSREDVDPNPVMSFFYYMLFGIMLSDAAYGVLVVLVSLFALKKLQLKPMMRKTMKLFLYCGISTIFWGAMFGSWFGDAVAVVSRTFFGKEIVAGPLWFEPLKDPMKMLIVSCIIGAIHILFGLGTKFYALWKQGHKWDAVCDAGFWMLLLIGLGGLAGGTIAPWIGEAGKYIALTAAAGIVLTGGRSAKNVFAKLGLGLYSLYGASGYLSDILSYSRLLALGLATGVIAAVFNSIAAMAGSGVVGVIMYIVVFTIGHTVNIAINLLGAYVHTNRLQYVEFFTKFYNGGGTAFRPLRANTKYYTLKEDHGI